MKILIAAACILSGNAIFAQSQPIPEIPRGLPDSSTHGVYFNSNVFQFVSDNIQYPADARAKEIQGNVIITVQIDQNGSLSNPVVTKSIFPSLDTEAIRVVNKMTAWTPAQTHGTPVSSSYQINVLFKL